MGSPIEKVPRGVVAKFESDSRIEEALRFIQKNLHRSFAIPEVAKSVGLSRSHFSYVFQSNTGLSPMQVIQEARLTRAAELLLVGPPLPLKQIAAEVGMRRADVLARAFRKQYSMTPTEFRLSQKPAAANGKAGFRL